MERLTNHFDYCKIIDCKFYDAELRKQGKCKFFDNSIEHCHEKRMNDKLREYEDAEDQGLLLRLPCKVGDTVYDIAYEGDYEGGEEFASVYPIKFSTRVFDDIGKTVFLTKEEAEAALAEMEK